MNRVLVGRHRPPPFRIYAISDSLSLPSGTTQAEATAQLLRAAPAGRVAIQLRDKQLSPPQRAELAHQLRAITRRHGAWLFINGDIKLARDCGADGVHFPDGHPGLTALTDSERRREAGAGTGPFWIGASCHDRAGLQRATALGADFVTLSPVMPSPGKASPGRELGWDRFTHLCEGCELPVFALGGLGRHDADRASIAGAYGVAAIRSLWQTNEPSAVISALLEPFAPLGSGARGGRIGRALSSGLALLLAASLGACGAALPSDDDDSAQGTDDDDSAEQTSPTPVDIPLPNGPFALECESSEPDDMDIPLASTSIIDPPWLGATNCGVVPATGQELLLHIRGTLQDLVVGTWDGDNDSFEVRFERQVVVRGVLRWDPLQGDFDARVLCERGDGWDDLFGHQLATTAVAESADAEFAIEAGASCWIVIVGFSGLVGSYDFWMEEIEPP